MAAFNAYLYVTFRLRVHLWKHETDTLEMGPLIKYKAGHNVSFNPMLKEGGLPISRVSVHMSATVHCVPAIQLLVTSLGLSLSLAFLHLNIPASPTSLSVYLVVRQCESLSVGLFEFIFMSSYLLSLFLPVSIFLLVWTCLPTHSASLLMSNSLRSSCR